LYEHGHDIFVGELNPDGNGDNSLLNIACKYGYLEMVKYFHEYCEPYHEESLSEAAAIACENNQLEILKYLYKNGAEIEDDYYGDNFWCAIKNGNLEIFKYLITLYNKPLSEYLVHACQFSRLNIIEYLHENKVELTSEDHKRILKVAAASGNLEIVKYIYESYGPYNKKELSRALYAACLASHFEISKYLHMNGADITDSECCYLDK
jgi:ankyrin repeat protein